MKKYELVLANQVYSGWGLRVWLIFKHFGIQFEHRVIPLYTEEFERFKQNCFPARQLPTLIVSDDGQDRTIWDSLSIVEFLNENHPNAGIWSRDANKRAAARSLCAEMHAGFKSLRSKMPVNLKRRYETFVPDRETQVEIDRLCELWRWASAEFEPGGPYLFGSEFTAADAFFAPVAARFRTYSIELNEAAQGYCDLLLNHPGAVEYYKAAQNEPWILQHNEFEMA